MTEDLEKKFGVTEEELDKLAEQYESGNWPEGHLEHLPTKANLDITVENLTDMRSNLAAMRATCER